MVKVSYNKSIIKKRTENMLNEKMIEMGENSSVIRELFEYGNKSRNRRG